MCPKCPYKTQYVQNFRRHKRSHTPSQKYKCAQCGKLFVDKYYLQKHMTKNHAQGYQKPLCEICGKSMADAKTLRLHKLIKHCADTGKNTSVAFRVVANVSR